MYRPLVRRLSGTRDLDQREILSLKAVQDTLYKLLRLHGYRIVDTPLLEHIDLFLRKSGGQLATRLYTFTNPGGHRVSLRPEFTSSIIRQYLQAKDTEPLPLRRQYAGPVFRFQSVEEGGQRQFTQVGAELIGASEAWADVEVLSIACHGLSAFGLSHHRIIMGHIGILEELLDQFNLSKRAKLFLIGNVSSLKNDPGGEKEVRRRGEELGLFRNQTDERSEEPLYSIGEESAQKIVQSLLKEVVATPLGSRTPDEILSRFLHKIQGSDAPAQVEKALRFLRQLANVEGDPYVALAMAKDLARDYKLNQACFNGLEDILTALAHHSLKDTDFSIDFGLVRDIAYYTGLVFEILPPKSYGQASLGGGGRYDSLIKALGSTEDVPALGFAYHLERVLEVVESKEKRTPLSEQKIHQVLLVAADYNAYKAAISLAQKLRNGGTVVHLETSSRNLEESLAYAAHNHLDKVIVVNTRGQSHEYAAEVGAKDVTYSPSQ